MSQPNRRQRQLAQTSASTQQGQIEAILQQVTVDNLPLPSPDALKGYAEVVPDAPQLFFRLDEEQVHHRIESERKSLEANIRALDASIAHSKRNAWMAYSLALALIAAFVIISVFAHNAYVAVGGLVVSVGSIITTFLVSNRQQERILRLQMSKQNAP